MRKAAPDFGEFTFRNCLEILAQWTLASRTDPSVSTSRCRLRPLAFLLPSWPPCSPPTPVAFADRESAMPALGSGSPPGRARSRSPSAALIRSKVPSARHPPNHR